MTEVDWKFDCAVEQMRIQRHDFMNYLQVIYGYIQVNKPEEAIKYIKRINSKMNVISMIFNLECPELSVLLQDYVSFCSKYNIDLELDSEIECISQVIISENIDDIKNCFEIIKVKSLEYIGRENRRINIKMYGDTRNLTIFISNDEELCSTHKNELLDNCTEINKCCKLCTITQENAFAFMLQVQKNV